MNARAESKTGELVVETPKQEDTGTLGKGLATNPPQADPYIEMIERVALNPTVDVEKLRAVLDMKREIFDKHAEIEFNQAMARVQGQIEPVVRDADNLQTGSKYARLETIVRVISPIYTSEGFALSFDTEPCPAHGREGWERFKCEVSHSGGYSKHHHVDLPMDATGIKGTVNKTSLHAYKSSLSYGRNMLVCMIFNVVLKNEDDDGNAGAVPCVTQEQAARLRDELEATGADVKRFCAWAKVEKIEDISAASFDTCLVFIKAADKARKRATK